MHETSRILLDLLVIFAAGKSMGEIFERINQPAVIGELLAGMLIGPAVLGWVHPSMTLQTVATMGVVVLMFVVGLETRSSELFRVGARSFAVGAAGVVLPMIAGVWFGQAIGLGWAEALFIGTALVATSVGITARVLADRGLITTLEARIVLAAAVIDDILGMLVLSLVAGSTRGAGLDVGHIGILLAQVVAFIAFELWVAPKLVRRHAHWLDRLRIPRAPLVVSLVVMLAMAAISESIGLAGIVGAFFAGMMFAETSDRWALEKQTKPLYEWLVPYFFVVTGMQADLRLFGQASVLVPGLVLTVIAIATKVIGCGLGTVGGGFRRALAVGVGMVPRGEVGLIVASMGLSLGVVSQPVYAMIIMVVLASTIVVPPLLPPLFAWTARASAESAEPVEATAEFAGEVAGEA